LGGGGGGKEPGCAEGSELGHEVEELVGVGGGGRVGAVGPRGRGCGEVADKLMGRRVFALQGQAGDVGGVEAEDELVEQVEVGLAEGGQDGGGGVTGDGGIVGGDDDAFATGVFESAEANGALAGDAGERLGGCAELGVVDDELGEGEGVGAGVGEEVFGAGGGEGGEEVADGLGVGAESSSRDFGAEGRCGAVAMVEAPAVGVAGEADPLVVGFEGDHADVGWGNDDKSGLTEKFGSFAQGAIDGGGDKVPSFAVGNAYSGEGFTDGGGFGDRDFAGAASGEGEGERGGGDEGGGLGEGGCGGGFEGEEGGDVGFDGLGVGGGFNWGGDCPLGAVVDQC